MFAAPHSQVLQEVAEASSDEEEQGGAVQRRLPPPPAADEPLPPEQEARRRAVLARLAQEDEEDVEPPRAQRPEEGDEVGWLCDRECTGRHGVVSAAPCAQASGRPGRGTSPPLHFQAGRSGSGALSGLWGWGAQLASKVEAAAVTVGREIAGTVHEAQPAVQEAAG